MIPQTFTLNLPPWPEYTGSSYRRFFPEEKHVTRVFPYYVLIFMLERKLYFSEDGRDIEVNAGEWYVQQPGLLQEGRRGSPSPVYYYIHFNMPEGREEEGRQLVLPLKGCYDVQHFIPWFDRLERLPKRSPADLLEVQSVFLSILADLTAACNPPASRSKELAVRLMDYLWEHYDKPVSNEALSRTFKYSPDYLIRVMRESFGVTPWQHVQQLRTEKARELLANTDLTLDVISEMVGYSDVSLFYKSFRKQMGTSPGAWRSRMRGIKKMDGT